MGPTPTTYRVGGPGLGWTTGDVDRTWSQDTVPTSFEPGSSSVGSNYRTSIRGLGAVSTLDVGKAGRYRASPGTVTPTPRREERDPDRGCHDRLDRTVQAGGRHP